MEIFNRAHAGAVEGVLGEGESVSWVGAQNKGGVHKRELTKKMFLHSDLLTSLTSSLTQLFFTIRELASQGNKVKIWRAINQSNRIIHTSDLSQTLLLYLRTILNDFEAQTILANGPIILEY